MRKILKPLLDSSVYILICTVLLYSTAIGAANAREPIYIEAELTSMDGEIYVNPDFVGKIDSVRTIDKNGLLGEKISIESRVLTDNWRMLAMPPEAAAAHGVIISGDRGLLNISKPSGRAAPVKGTLQPVADVEIPFGTMYTTLKFPSQTVLEPSKYSMEILDNNTGSFTKGDIIAMKNDQAAVYFSNLGPSALNEEGNLKISMKKPDGSFINSEVPAWGYNVMVSEADLDEAVPITAEVFGLPQDSKVRFQFDSLSDQIIDPSLVTLTVKEVNSGRPISTVKTKIAGSQPLSVTVSRVN